MYQCRACCKVIKRRDCPMEMHKCDHVKCPSCARMVKLSTHRCFLMKISPKKSSEKLIFFDFETDMSSGEHEVNFALAQYANGDEQIFKGYEACNDFCSWLFTAKHKNYTAVAHNMKG